MAGLGHFSNPHFSWHLFGGFGPQNGLGLGFGDEGLGVGVGLGLLGLGPNVGLTTGRTTGAGMGINGPGIGIGVTVVGGVGESATHLDPHRSARSTLGRVTSHQQTRADRG